MGLFCYLNEYYPDMDDFHKSTATVMATLVIRHLFKKWFDCCPAAMLQFKQDEQEKFENHKGSESDRLLPPEQPGGILRSSYLAMDSEDDSDSDDISQSDKENSGYGQSKRRNFCDSLSGVMQGFFYYKGRPAKITSVETDKAINVARLSIIEMSPRHY